MCCVFEAFSTPGWFADKLSLLSLISISYGTAKSGVGISAMSVLRPDLMMKCVVPVIMAGIIAVSQPALNRIPQTELRSPIAFGSAFLILG